MLFRRRDKICLVFFALLCAFAPLFAQSDTWYYDKPVRDIKIEGLNTIRQSDLDGITRAFLGKRFSDDFYISLINRLYALEYFDDISPEVFPTDEEKRGPIVIKLTVKEKPVLTEIRYEGNKGIKTTELSGAVSEKTKQIFNESKLRADEAAILELYLKKGYVDAKVSSKVEGADSGVAVTFLIDEGSATILHDVKFEGNSVFNSKTLAKQMEMKPDTKIMSKGFFRESALEADKERILAFYFERGYIDAKIVDVIRETSRNEKKSRDELTLTFVIEEGAQYVFGGVSFSGNEIFSSEVLGGKIRLKPGEVFNDTKMREGLQAVADLYFESGYTSNTLEPVESRDDAAHEISYKISIVERPRSHIESIIVQGNTRTKEFVILRELGIESGDIFSKEKLLRGLRNLYNLQYFSAVAPDIVPGSEENLVNLVINVEEQSTTTLEFGLTFSGVSDPTIFPLSLFSKWQNSNFLGLGKSIAANVTLSPDNQEFGMTYADYWLFGVPLWSSVGFSVSHATLDTPQSVYVGNIFNTEDYYMTYSQWSLSFNGALGYKWYPKFATINLQGGLSTEFVRNGYDDDILVPNDISIGDYAQQWGVVNSISSSVSLDARDLSHDPSKGWFLSERISWTGFFPTVEDQFFMRSDTKLEGYWPLFNIPVSEKWAFKMILAGYAGLSFQAHPKTSYIGSSRQLYIDGMFVGRGWSSIYNLRGMALFSSFAELRWPVLPQILAIDFFFDAAALKPKIQTMFGSLKGEDFYFSFGPGLRFILPQFPLRLLFANTFQVDGGGVKWRNGVGPDWSFVLSFNVVNR